MEINLTEKIISLTKEVVKIPNKVIASLENGDRMLLSGGTKVLNKDGEELFLDPKMKDMDLAYVLETSLLAELESDKDEERFEKTKRWRLAQDIYANRTGSIELDTDTCKYLKDRVSKCFSSVIINGNVDDIIEGRRNN